MKKRAEQMGLFGGGALQSGGVVFVNERCRIQESDEWKVVSVLGVAIAHYAVEDKATEAYAMVNLVEQGWASQTDVAQAFGCDVRTVRRNVVRAEEGGIAALGRSAGYPKGRSRNSSSRARKVYELRSRGLNNCQIARCLGVSEKAIRKSLIRLGWREAGPVQAEMPLEGSDPNLSAFARSSCVEVDEPCLETAPQPSEGEDGDSEADAAFTIDTDPDDRRLDRFLACVGVIEDAAPVFGTRTHVPGAGVLLAIPALLGSGVLDCAREIYGSLGPAFYGLRTTVMTLLLMALQRIKRPEGLKERCPRDLGRTLGLDRAPETKTLRRKLTRLSAARRAAAFGQALARCRVAARGEAMGFMYVDGHVRVYYGKRPIPKTSVARIRISMPATTDYWVNDASGEPLFVVSTEANRGLVRTLPGMLEDVRSLVGERRVTVVFDRGGWSPRLFEKLLKEGFDFITYRKFRWRRVARKLFQPWEATMDGQIVRYVLADQGIRLRSGLRFRQVVRLREDGKQTPIVTSRRDLSAIEVAHRMFSRWRQENFFKYLREEYALDALAEYDEEPADPNRQVPNPERARIDAELKKARISSKELLAQYGLDAITHAEPQRRAMRGFKTANAAASKAILAALKRVTDLEHRRAAIPPRVPVLKARPDEVVKLALERQHLMSLLKMVAYQAESDLVHSLAPLYRRSADEGRTLIQDALAQPADLRVAKKELHVKILPLSSPHRTRALANLCNILNATHTCFPGSKLNLVFGVNPEPLPSPAFPGPRTPPKTRLKPDSLE